MIGRRLASGLHAVPVRKAKALPGGGSYQRFWRLELECGHVLERHPAWSGDRAPRFAGCPEGCGAEIGSIRREIAKLENDLVAEQRKRWEKGRRTLAQVERELVAEQRKRWAKRRQGGKS